MKEQNTGHSDLQKGGACWTWIELAALLVGLLVTATACLVNYGWHWKKESLFFMIFSAGLMLFSYCVIISLECYESVRSLISS